MRLPRRLVPARFVRRLNRFAVLVRIEGRAETAHLPNSGRLRELLQRGRLLYLAPATSEGRRTAFDVTLAQAPGALVCADARLPGPLFCEAVREGRLAEFRGYARVTPEVRYGESRLDARLDGPDGTALVEVKSVTLVRRGAALFPDAPTARGARHLEELTRARREGLRAAVCFIVQREDARRFRPYAAADPVFSATLRRAAASGVEVYAYRCRVSRSAVRILGRIPVLL